MVLPNSTGTRSKYTINFQDNNYNNEMTIYQGIYSHIPTGKCFSLYPRNTNKPQFLFISSSYYNHIRNMNIKVFCRVIMRSDFEKILGF